MKSFVLASFATLCLISCSDSATTATEPVQADTTACCVDTTKVDTTKVDTTAVDTAAVDSL